jgi:hypothetical protein
MAPDELDATGSETNWPLPLPLITLGHFGTNSDKKCPSVKAKHSKA